MRKRMAECCVNLIIFMLVANIFPLILGKSVACTELETIPSHGGNLFTPFVGKPSWADQDDNGVSDSLDSEITDRVVKGTASDYVNVTIMLSSAPSARDVDDFNLCGGYVTTPLWTNATYGFGGTISFNGLLEFVRQSSSVLLVEKDAITHSTIAYAAQQVGARDYVWDNVGLQGDSGSSIAILDSGIDASHTDFSPGFGDQNFSKKIVGWSDQIGNTSTPFDDFGHGSHCAGLASGNGFFSTDASGNAIATSGYRWGWFYNRTFLLLSGSMMVNKTGMITVKVRWIANNTSSITAVMLYCGNNSLDEQSWVQTAAMSTPNPNNWYTLTYNVTALPSSGYDIFHLKVNQTYGKGPLWLQVDLSWPWTEPQDGFSAWTGIAPASKLVGVRVLSMREGDANQLISGINWIIANKTTYHITVASMSLGFDAENVAVDNAIVNLVNSGITVVVSAGNSGPGDNYIFSPGSVDEVITVAAMNQYDNVANYSNQGGTSRYAGHTTKPDILAPGGSYHATTILSADSSYSDGMGGWPDSQPDDAYPMCGTSMAAPVVAGATNILIQAMGGYNWWQYTRSQALQPKMLLLMTATETYPNLRETYDSGWSPTLQRGGKDMHEGYGRLNLDAAVDAWLLTYVIGSNVTGTLGRPPTINDTSVLGQRQAWARRTLLTADVSYTFHLSIPAGADYDLYLYNSTGTTYGEPAIVAKSITAATGGSETLTLMPPYTGAYYLVVKRATEATGSGDFTLTSTSGGGGGGGCPYVYTWNGFDYVKDNNILPASETGDGTDTRDYYGLQQPLVAQLTTRRASIYSVQVREFENEHDYIDQVKLIAVDHSQDISIAVTSEGEILTYQEPASPASCVDHTGIDRSREIGLMDGDVSDPTTYFQGNEGDWLLMNFGRVTAANAKLILRDDQKCSNDFCINVQVPYTNGGWDTVEVLNPRDYWAIEAVNLTAYVPANDDLVVRLLWTASHKLDYVGLDTSPQSQSTVNTVLPILALHSQLGNVTSKLLCDDEESVELVKGQYVTLAFRLANNEQGTARDFIFFSNGYYYTIVP